MTEYRGLAENGLPQGKGLLDVCFYNKDRKAADKDDKNLYTHK